MRKLSVLLLPILFMFSPGCIIMDHENPGCVGESCYEDTGDIRFYWAFEEIDGSVTDWCNVADVARIDIVIYDGWGNLEFEAPDRPCEEMGAIIDHFLPGTYEIQLVGICPTGRVTHEGWWEFDVYGGTNDLGTLILDYLGACD